MKQITKLLIITTLILSQSFTKEIKPLFTIASKALVLDFVIDGYYLYVGNNEGSVEIFDIRSAQKVDEILIAPNYSAKGTMVHSRILSVDRYNGKTLIVSTTTNGYNNIWLHDGVKLRQIIKSSQKIDIKEARFLGDDDFIFGTLGYDVINYSLGDNYSLYSNQIEQSAFSDMAISRDKKSIATASESGQVMLIDTKSGAIIKEFKPLNLDNIYKIAMQNGTIITAGQDRRVGVYPSYGTPYYIKSNFLVYSVGLSPSGKWGVYSSNEDNDLQLFDTRTGAKKDVFVGHNSVPSTIKFISEDGFFSAGYGYEIYYWRLK